MAADPVSPEDFDFEEDAPLEASGQSIPVILFNVPRDSADCDTSRFDDSELTPVTTEDEVMTVVNNKGSKFKIGDLKCQTVALSPVKGSPNRKRTKHHFINTGEGAITSMNFSDFFKNGSNHSRLLAVAKSTRTSMFKGDNSSSLQLWCVNSQNPGQAKLVKRYLHKNRFITQVKWAVDLASSEPNTPKHLLAVVDGSGNLTLRQFTVSQKQRNGAGEVEVSQSLLLTLEATAAAKFSCVDVSRSGDIVHLIAGNAEGLTLIYRFRYHAQQSNISLVGSTAASLTKAPVTAVMWLPGTNHTFYAIGTSLGTFVVGDRRNPTFPRLLSTDYASRPIVQLSPGNIVGTVVGSHVTGFIFSTLYLESSHHHPLKALVDAKSSGGTRKKETNSAEVTNNRWTRAFFPEHRIPVSVKAFEQPSTACGAVRSECFWTFEDGSALTGFLPDLDRKAYNSSGVVQWSLIQPVEDKPQMADEAAGGLTETSEIIEHTTQAVDRCFELGLASAREHGVLITLSSYHAMIAAYKQHVNVTSSKAISTDSFMASAYITRLSAVAELKGLDRAYFAYGGNLGLIHIMPCGIFDDHTHDH